MQSSRPGTSIWRPLVLAWALAFGLSLTCAGVFVHGIVRDTRPFDPEIRLDVGTASGWESAPFRVWGDKTYSLLIRSVNHNAALVGRPLMAGLDIRVLNPGGEPVLHRSYGPGETGHEIPDNYGDVRLAMLTLSDWPFRAWDLQVRVTEPDPRFLAVSTDVELYEQRPLVGMGGLISYAMIFPSGTFMLVALALAVPLARSGLHWPLVVTGAGAFLMLLVLG